MDELIEKYIKLRDGRDALKKRHAEEMAKIAGPMDQLAGILLDNLSRLGVDSVKGKHGTAFKSTKVSVTVGDWDETLAFIQENDLWHMLNKAVSKDAVKQYRDEHGDIPPGVKYQEILDIGIRRT